MARDYAAIIAAMREKARRTEYKEEKEALEAKANELEEKYKVDKPVPVYEADPTDWIRQNYRMSEKDFVNRFFMQERPVQSQFLIVVTGEDQKWRHSYLWPMDGSPVMDPYHPWVDTEE